MMLLMKQKDKQTNSHSHNHNHTIAKAAFYVYLLLKLPNEPYVICEWYAIVPYAAVTHSCKVDVNRNSYMNEAAKNGVKKESFKSHHLLFGFCCSKWLHRMSQICFVNADGLIFPTIDKHGPSMVEWFNHI